MRQSRPLRRTSPVAVDDRGRSYAEPVCVLVLFAKGDLLPWEEGERTHLIKVYFNAAYIRRAYGNHAEKPMPPAPKHRNTFVQHEQILHALRHPG